MPIREVRRIRSGLDSAFGWVTLWYAVETRTLEVLHVACDKKDRRLYLEEQDQSISCWGQAKRVIVTDQGIRFTLTAKGSKTLSLPPDVTLAPRNGLVGWTKARKTLLVMATCPSGRVIQCVPGLFRLTTTSIRSRTGPSPGSVTTRRP